MDQDDNAMFSRKVAESLCHSFLVHLSENDISPYTGFYAAFLAASFLGITMCNYTDDDMIGFLREALQMRKLLQN